jgi:Circadian oscillating protein COP23
MSSRNWLIKSVIFGVLLTSKSSLPAKASGEAVSSSAKYDFECIPLDSNGTRFATRPITSTTNQIAPPLLIWESPEFSSSGYTPERRCKEVTARLKAAVSTVEGNTTNLRLTMGSVNELPVLCHVQSEESCDSSRVIFTLNRKNRANPASVMATMLKFTTTGVGTGLVE